MYHTILLPVVLYGCGTWSLILRGEHRLRVCWGRYLGLGGMKLQEGDMHGENIHDLCSLPNIIIIIIIITAFEFPLGGSSPYTSTDKQIKNKYT
jgi:hypothetical protein